MDPKGYYACLGVEPWANADQIRAAYHRGARLYHPDHNPSPQAKARFQAINEAYRTLSNPTNGAPTTGRDGALRRAASGPTLSRSLEADRADAIRSHPVKGLAQFVGGGALGLTLLVLLSRWLWGHMAPSWSPAPPPRHPQHPPPHLCLRAFRVRADS